MKKRVKNIIVVLLLVFCAAMIVNRVIYVTKKEKQKEYDKAMSYILDKIKIWHNDNLSTYNKSIIVNLTLKDLYDAGYIENGFLNSLTNAEFKLDMPFCVINDNGEYKYEYDDLTNCGRTHIEKVSIPEESYNGYLYSETINIDYSSLEGLEYYIKSSNKTEASINVNFSCGTGSKPSKCKEIKSTKNISENTWYKVSGSLSLLYDNHSDELGTLYTLVTDNQKFEYLLSTDISKIDKVNPVIVLESPLSTTNSISVKISSMIDNETGIASSTCRYGTTGEYNTLSMSNTRGKLSKCIINYKLKDKVYYYQICATDKVGNVGCASGSSLIQSVKNPLIYYLDDNKLSVDFNNKDKALMYYIKSDVAISLNDSTIAYCGKGELPSSCINNTVNELLPGVWYRVNNKLEVTPLGNGILYASIYTTNDTYVTTTANIKK